LGDGKEGLQMEPLSFIIVGSGWRAMFYVRIAKSFPGLFQLKYMLCRSKEKAERVSFEQGIPATAEAAECEAAKPDFVVIAVSKEAVFEVAKQWVLKGFAVLCETPAAMTVEELRELWELKERCGAKLQVAEQYTRYPILAAGLKAIRQGRLGEPYAVSLSAAHDYHGASLIRHMLQAGPGPIKMWGKRYLFPVTQTDSRYGAVADGSIKEWGRTCITMEFGNGKMACYDFSGVQYHSFIRSRHVNVQGRDGEWNDTILRYVGEGYLPVEEKLMPYLPSRYAALETERLRQAAAQWDPILKLDIGQDEYAIASMMFDMGRYLEGGEEVYPLAEALEDAYTWLLMKKAEKDPGHMVQSETMPWHNHK